MWGGSQNVTFLKGEAGIGWGNGKRRWAGGLAFEEMGVSYLGTPDLPFFAVFWVRAKSQNTVIYSVFVPFGMDKYFLQHAEIS